MTAYQEPQYLIPLPDNYDRAVGVFNRPSKAFIEDLADRLRGKRVLEVFAGNGFLAAHLIRLGVSVTPTTLLSGHDQHDHGFYTNVTEMDAREAVLKLGKDHDVLLMSWPTVTLAAAGAALLWGTDRDLVYIGETTDYLKNQFGGCATDEFFEWVEFKEPIKSYTPSGWESAAICRVRSTPVPLPKPGDEPASKKRRARP